MLGYQGGSREAGEAGLVWLAWGMTRWTLIHGGGGRLTCRRTLRERECGSLPGSWDA